MDEQLELMGVSPSRPLTLNLFLAIFPAAEAVNQMLALGPWLRSSLGLGSKLVHPDRLHLTLQWLGEFAEMPDRVAAAAGRACETISARSAPCNIRLDRVIRLGGEAITLAAGKDDNAGLRELHQALDVELTRNACPRPKGSRLAFTPHVTLLYDRKDVDAGLPEPICWQASEIALVCSEKGTTQYHRLGHWNLRSGA
ncbi:MAG: hypothetical protein JWO08_1663 [Verrucomicrobiaceae bacterium]|nr:hypothetical protein [Verrucomicrobiaceae bacterium]